MRLRMACACLLALAFGAGSADGYVTEGRAWPGGVITYYNAAPDQAWAVRTAVEAWNASGARVRFVAVPESQAQLRIEHFPNVPCTVNAEATLGYTPNARVFVFRLDQRSPYCNSYMAVESVAHELGHVLGLGHETRGCALMNPEGGLQGPSLCPQAHPWQWRCRLLTQDDIAGAIALYGGTPRAHQGPRDCDDYPGESPPTQLAVAWTGAPRAVRLTFRRPSSPVVPTFLSVQHQQSEGFAVSAAERRCGTNAAAAARYRWDVQPGQTEQTVMTLAPGTYCLTAWAIDSFGRPSPKPGTLWVRI